MLFSCSAARIVLTTFALFPFLSFASPLARSTSDSSDQVLTIPLRRQTQQALLYLNFAAADNPSSSSSSSDDPSQEGDGKYNAPVANQQVQVVTAVQTGNGQTFPNVLVDTGSAFLWVNAGQTKYAPGPHSQPTNETFSVGYGAGSAKGNVWVDQVSIGKATVRQQYVGAAENITSFSELVDFDGILGLGLDIGNNGSISGQGVTPTFVDSLYNEHTISKRTIGIYLEPYVGDGGENDGGEITFGGVDSSRFTGEIVYVPQRTDNKHWAVQIDSVEYGSTSLQNTTSEAIVDTGTLPILLPFTAFFALRTALNGTIINSGPLAGWLSAPANSTSASLQPLALSIGGSSFSIPPEAYLIPESLYAHYNISEGGMKPTWFASGGFGNAALGQKFLELFYSVYDSDNLRIGFAPTA